MTLQSRPGAGVRVRCVRSALWGLGVAAAFVVPDLIAHYVALQQGRFLMMSTWGCVGILPFLAVLAFLPIRMLQMLDPVRRPQRLPGLVFAVSALTLVLASGTARSALNRLQANTIAERSEPVITAIQEYLRTHEEPPSDLEELFPEYLEARPNVPGLRIGRRESDGKSSWSLFVPTTGGFMDFSDLYYLPEQDYPAVDRRFGRWAFFAD